MTPPRIRYRTFETYGEYVYKQGGKARGRRDELIEGLERNTRGFESLFKTAAPHLRPGAVLCLGARTGAEVLGARRAGFAGSVGIDLHPVGDIVQQADWHEMPFADATFPNAYTNALDHCLSLDRLVAEVRRVLVPDGIFYVMASDRWPGKTYEAWLEKGGNEALYWQDADDLGRSICGYGFATVQAWRLTKWSHFILRRLT